MNWRVRQIDLVHRLVEVGIPVMAHVGLTPQSVYGLGGYKVQGRGEAAQRVLEQAQHLEKAGAFAVVLEAMPSDLASDITASLQIPTIGIGAGPRRDAHVLFLGLNEKFPTPSLRGPARCDDGASRPSDATSRTARSPTTPTATARYRGRSEPGLDSRT